MVATAARAAVACLIGLCLAAAGEDGPGSQRWQTEVSWRGRVGVQWWGGGASENSPHFLHRLRGAIAARPAAWLGLEMEFQDARSFDTLPGSGMHAFHDPLEVRVAQIRLGSEEGEGWRMTPAVTRSRLGRSVCWAPIRSGAI